MTFIITLLIGIAGLYFLPKNELAGIILIIWAMLRFYVFIRSQISKSLSFVTKNSERTNILFVVSINVVSILNSSSVRNFLNHLKNKNVVDFKNEDACVKNLIEIYKEKYKNKNEYTNEKKQKTYLWEKVEFNLKNGLLWKNGKIDFSDVIYHEISIPLKYTGEKEGDDDLFGGMTDAIRIRFLMVNGLLKAQIGRFDKSSSPKVVRDTGLAVFQEWQTISTFPVMYSTQLFPDKYLNFSMYATEAYNHMGVEENTDWTKDWKEISKERNEYGQLYGLGDDDELDSNHIKILKVFIEKEQKTISSEGFINHNPSDDSGWPVPGWMKDNSIWYSNDYLNIKIHDLNEEKKKFEEFYSSDYYHEQP